MDRGGGGSSFGGALGAASGSLLSFIKIGFLGVGLFAIGHLVGCWFLSFITGFEFSTIVYVTAAAVTTGTLVTFTIAFLVTLNIALTAVTGLTSGASSMFGGGLGGLQSPPPSSHSVNNPHPTRSQSFTTREIKLD